MSRLDRALGLLLHLRSGRPSSAAELARRFQVSVRTIYRDMEMLSALGVPVYAERGRAGGIRLLPGYFLPPVMFSVAEATSLVLGFAMLRSLRARPFPAEMEAAEGKLLAALPERLAELLRQVDRLIGFEGTPHDVFHPERGDAPHLDANGSGAYSASESAALSIFIQALIDGRSVRLRYRSPYRAAGVTAVVRPLGAIWDRDRWYLVGHSREEPAAPRFWRADRVCEIAPALPATLGEPDFDVRDLLGRRWLAEAMAQWAREAPVRVRVSARQAERLAADWYYRHARYERAGHDHWLLTFGEDEQERVFELLRWLGPEAELLEPAAWRAGFRRQLSEMAARHAGDGRPG